MTTLLIIGIISSIILGVYIFNALKEKANNFFNAFKETSLRLEKEKELENLKSAALLLHQTRELITGNTFNLKTLLEIASIKELEIFNSAIAELEKATTAIRKEYNETLGEIYKNTNLKIASATNTNTNANTNQNINQMLESAAKSLNLNLNEFQTKLQAKNITNDQFAALSREERRKLLDEIKNS